MRFFPARSRATALAVRSVKPLASIETLEPRSLLSVSYVDGRQMESLDRGVVAVNQGSGKVYVGWRMLATDPDDVTFNVYRSTGGGAAVKLNAAPVAQTTDFVNTGVDTTQGNVYSVRPIVDGVEQATGRTFALPANAPAQQHLSVPLQIPPGGTSPDGVAYTYTAGDTSVGDLDGDGQYEFIVKWDPTNQKDNAQAGYTGHCIVDAYKLDGTRLWRIDLGKNIRAGAHYTQFIVYDLDGDGKAEVAMKTADGTVDGAGTVIGSATADWRNTGGYILSGPEFLTIFNGQTGAAMATANYNPQRGNVADWGDNYGNRVDRFLATVAYLDGVRPSLVMTRGYYDKSVLSAWDWRGGALTSRWTFDSKAPGNDAYSHQGNHNLTAADVDGDGKDEIVFGAATIDDDGTGLYSTGLGHGDALHVSDMNPDRPGLEVFKVNESPADYGTHGGAMWDAATGQILVSVPGTGDVGRGVAFDIDPRHRGFESWTSANANVYNVNGQVVSTVKPSKLNFGIWWDADPLRELLDTEIIDKWNWSTNTLSRLLTAYNEPAGADAINGTKSSPNLSGDVIGDWREEVIFRRWDNTALQIFTTTTPSTMRLDTLAHDAHYRMSLAWQNVGYNQPAHTGFYLGDGMTMPAAAPASLTATAGAGRVDLAWTASAGATSYNVKRATSATGPFATVATGVTGTAYANAGLGGSTTYYYLVTAVNAAGGSLNSNLASATTPAGTANAAPTVATAAAAGPGTVAGTTTSLSVLGADDNGEANLTYAWSAAGPAAVAYSANGTHAAKNATATFARAGSYTFTVTITDAAGLATTSSVAVVVQQTATTLDVTPATATVDVNATRQFAATVLDQFGQGMTATLAWSVQTGAGTISAAGLYTAPATAGSAVVRAAVGTLADTASVMIAAPTATAPAAPTNLTATAANSGQINLTWTRGSANEDGFTLQRSTDGTTFDFYVNLPAGATSYANAGLTAATAYTYRIHAWNGVGRSADSNYATATTPVALPAAPTNLAVTVSQKTKARLAWVDNASNETGFKIWSSRDGVNWTLLTTLATASAGTGRTVTYTTGALASGTWHFRVTAYNAAGESTASNVGTITI